MLSEAPSPPSHSDSMDLPWGPELFFDNRLWMVLAQVLGDSMREPPLWIRPQIHQAKASLVTFGAVVLDIFAFLQ